MKVLFVPWSQPTFYYQMVPLAWALRAAGAEVRVAGQPQLADAVKRSGLTITQVGAGYDYLPAFQRIADEIARHNREHPDRKADLERKAAPTPEMRRRVLERKFAPFVETATAMAGELVELAGAWRPDLVVSNPFVLAAPLAAHASGARLVHHLTGPAVERQMGFFPGSGAAPELWTQSLLRLFEGYGVPVRPEYASATVDPCPQSLQYPGTPDRLPVRFVPYNGPGDAPLWLSRPAGRPRVCVTWGTTTTQLGGEDSFLVPDILAALSGLDTEVVLAVKGSDRELLGEVPANVRVVEDLPLHLLLPSCDAIVHQGGTGTMLTAASFGVPQVLIAGMLDQVATATRLASSGAGLHLDAAGFSPAALTAAVGAALADGTVRKAADALRQEIADQPSPADVAGQLADAPAVHAA
ncbi:nucleotide disphospho-sugar-binding domain-containing protein [Streptomyces cyanogenus]|uniref:Desosaminyl transferase EryCIII n=1 Tax=Streptomyces cyanogenus TaxID=80860 RepID=A0ABX7TJA4_STRCY|nr:nucleotide disphospho-sugar-binding domain-containing protein [Streptomyces cyanogenus]QTD96710.1 Desosaminyl transferase EryCIII precursor [Streptomyces cyanogenus]